MKKITFLTIVVIVLILLNIVVLGFVFTKENHPSLPEGRRPEPKDIIIKKLHFDEAQQEKYKAEITKHRKEIRELDKAIRENKHKLYDLLATTYTEQQKDSLIGVIVDNQRKVEETHFNHFQDIKAICKPDQLEYFNELTRELPKLFAPQRPRERRE